jgi:DNA-binding response OmpR family regulator
MKSKTIMIVDDDDDLLFLLKTQLVLAGYTVNVCQNGDSLIEKLKLEKPDLVLLDINMLGVDGGKLCSTIKKDKRLAGIKVILVSGNYDIKKISLRCGADGYLTKPVSLPVLENKISLIISPE